MGIIIKLTSFTLLEVNPNFYVFQIQPVGTYCLLLKEIVIEIKYCTLEVEVCEK